MKLKLKDLDALGWVETDDDCSQLVLRCDPFRGRFFELYQITALPNEEYGVSHDTIDVENYSERDILDALNAYGYSSLDEFVVECAASNEFSRRPDGSLDPNSPAYIVDYELIAEMLFELEAFDCLVPNKTFCSWDEAKRFIYELIAASKRSCTSFARP